MYNISIVNHFFRKQIVFFIHKLSDNSSFLSTLSFPLSSYMQEQKGKTSVLPSKNCFAILVGIPPRYEHFPIPGQKGLRLLPKTLMIQTIKLCCDTDAIIYIIPYPKNIVRGINNLMRYPLKIPDAFHPSRKYSERLPPESATLHRSSHHST